MLHASLPAGHPWQGMSHLGQDLVLHPQARSSAAATSGQPLVEPLHHHPHHHHYAGHHLPLHHVAPMMGHHLNTAVHHNAPPLPAPISQPHIYASSDELLCQQQQQIQHHSATTYQTFHQTYTIHHQTAVRTVTSRQSLEGGMPPAGVVGMRHASGGSQSGSSHRGTPPSPADEATSRAIVPPYRPHLNQQQQQLLLERGTARAASFDQTSVATANLAAPSSEHASNSSGAGSPASSSPHSVSGGNHHLHQQQHQQQQLRTPASPASLNVPQKSPFDLTTLSMGSLTQMAYKSTATSVGRTDSVIAAALRPPPVTSSASTPGYQQAANKIKQEPGSPATNQFGHNLAGSRAVKQEPGGSSGNPPYHPQSPQSGAVTATPPPRAASVVSYSPAHLERIGSGGTLLGQAGAEAPPPLPTPRPSGGMYGYPSPRHTQATTPISPASSTGDGRSMEATKFRYHSGQQQSQQGHGSLQNPSPQGEETNCNSAMSSREGTPGPPLTRHQWTPGGGSGSSGPDDLSGPAPNVDISRVKIKEEVNSNSIFSSNISTNSSSHHHSRMLLGYDALGSPTTTTNDYSRRPSINLSYPASGSRNSPSDNNNSSSNNTAVTALAYPVAYTPSYHPHPHHPHHLGLGGGGQPVALPARGGGGGRGGGGNPPPPHHHRGSHYSHPGRPPLGLPSNSGEAGGGGPIPHSNVKIGRRPAHLPKVLKFEDPTLPHGWQRKLKQRKHGKQAGRWDVYIYSPCGVKFASRKKLKNFFEKNNLNYDAEQFDFTPYGKHIDQVTASMGGGVGSSTVVSHRHHSSASSDGGGGSLMSGSRHSPGSPASGSFTTSNSSQLSTGIPPEFLSPAHHHLHHHPPSAHLHHVTAVSSGYVLPSYEFNPMMESPPNANAREIPQNHILNLSSSSSSSSALVGSSAAASGGRNVTATVVSSSNPPVSSSFPTDIAELLNDSSSLETRRFREFQTNSSINSSMTSHHPHQHLNLNHPLHPHHHPHHHLQQQQQTHHLHHHHQPAHAVVDNVEDLYHPGGGGGMDGATPEDHHSRDAAAAAVGASEDDNRFMSRTIDILSDGNSDLGVMMDMDYMYTE